MAFTSVTAAALMKDSGDGFALGVVVFVLLLGVLVGVPSTAASSCLSRVPDIIVTLAMSFVWAGAALLVLSSPGGGAAQWFKDLATGPVVVDWFPKALLLVLICVAVVWLPAASLEAGLVHVRRRERSGGRAAERRGREPDQGRCLRGDGTVRRRRAAFP